jgi:hypothetical protein
MRGICGGFRRLRWVAGDLTMQAGAKRLTAWVAILAIALQAVLAGFPAWSPAAAATVDPATVICHSAPPSSDSSQQAPSPATHDGCCNQCILCGCLSAASLPAVGSTYIPPRLFAVRLVPLFVIEPFAHRASGPNLPRGPPSSLD